MFTLQNTYRVHFSKFIYTCSCSWILFQAGLQAEKDKVHTLEKAALQKDQELDQCQVCTQYIWLLHNDLLYLQMKYVVFFSFKIATQNAGSTSSTLLL